jgi:hypothetical protein
MQTCGADGVDAAGLDPAGVDAGARVALLGGAAVVMRYTLGTGFD